MKKYWLICCLLGLSLPTWSQHSYDLQLVNPTVDCMAHQFCTTLQIRASLPNDTFSIGSHTIFLNYNINILQNPSYQSLHFDNTDSCFLGMSVYMQPALGFDGNTGEINITTNMTIPNNGCPTVDDEWTDMGHLCFELLGNVTNTDVDLVFNPVYITINQNNEQPQHLQGQLIPLHFQPDCSDYNDDDGDGITNIEENTIGTNPNAADTDDDGLSDGQEWLNYETNPLSADSDNDNLGDWDEIITYQTNPNVADSDGDQLSDFEEIVTYQTNAIAADTDGDQLSDFAEVINYGSNPNLSDSDGDSLPDAQEIATNQQNINTDQDTFPNILDDDDDGDGILTIQEDTNQNGTLWDDDDDNDGTPDFLDPDAIGGISAVVLQKPSIFPNPTQAYLYVLLPATMPYYLELNNYLGQQVWSSNGAGNTKIDVRHLPNGLYQMTIVCPTTNNRWVQKIIVCGK